MSNQNSYYYQQQQQQQQQQSGSQDYAYTNTNTNPWADQQSQHPPPGLQQPLQPQNQSHPQSQSGYEPPPGPPAQRSNTFEENRFVPADQRGEQREAMEQFEMNRSKPESQTERDVAKLQEEFPGLDGSLIAAIYGDSQSLGATREMLQELAGGAGQGQGGR